MLNLMSILSLMIKLIRFTKKTPCVALSTGVSRFFLFRQGLFEIKIEENEIILKQDSFWFGNSSYKIFLNEIIEFLSFQTLFCKGIRIVHKSRYLDEYIVIFPLTHEQQIQTEIQKFAQRIMSHESKT